MGGAIRGDGEKTRGATRGGAWDAGAGEGDAGRDARDAGGDDGTRRRAEDAARRAETLARAAATRRAKGEGEEEEEEGRDGGYGAEGAEAVAMAEGKLNAAFDAWLDAGEARWWPSGLR